MRTPTMGMVPINVATIVISVIAIAVSLYVGIATRRLRLELAAQNAADRTTEK